jgi:salicylate hydroxylase
MWLGPKNHAVFYPVRNGAMFNLVLLKPDDMETGKKTEPGDLQEMLDSFAGWDPM